MAAADASAAGPPSLCHGLPVFQKTPAPWTMPPYRRRICQRSKSFRQARPKASVMRAPRNILLLMAFCWLYLFAVGPTTEKRNRQQPPGVTPAPPAQLLHLSSYGDDLANSDLAARNTALQAVVAERIDAQEMWEQAISLRFDEEHIIRQANRT